MFITDSAVIMNYQEKKSGSKNYDRLRGSMHIGMGLFYLVTGVLVLYVKYFGTLQLPDMLAYALGVLMLAYGVFRIWRGVASIKNIR